MYTLEELQSNAAGRYRGLGDGQIAALSAGNSTEMLERPEVVQAQIDADAQPVSIPAPSSPTRSVQGAEDSATATLPFTPGQSPPPATAPRRFYGTVELDEQRVGRNAGKIAEEVIAHLTALPGTQVRITLEIEANIPDSAPDNVVCTVTENSRTLKLTNQGFKEV